MREVLLFCAAAGRGTPLRGRHRQGIVRRADHDLRYGALGCVDAELDGVIGEAVIFVEDIQRPGLQAARSGGAFEVCDALAARAGELAGDKALADVERFGRGTRFGGGGADAAVADERGDGKAAVLHHVGAGIADAAVKERERLGSERYVDGACAVGDVERGVEARLFAAAFERAAVFAAREVAVIEDRERLIERGVASVGIGRQAGGSGGRVNTQTVFSVPLVAPAEGVDRVGPGERKIGDAAVVENGILFFLVIDLCAVDADLVACQCDGDTAALRLASLGNIGALRAACGDVERLGGIVPVGLHAHETA